MSTIDDLAATLNNHQVTDDDGQVISESAPEKVDSLESESQSDEELEEQPKVTEDEPSEAEDEDGHKYVPEKRFKEIYGQKKALEREIASLKQGARAPTPAPSLDRTQALEMEYLFDKFPEFNPNDPKYSQELDALAGKFVQANPLLSPIQAAKEAKEFARRIASKIDGTKSDTVIVKKTIADSGMAQRSQTTSDSPIDVENASVDEIERYLKSTGNW